MFKGFWEELDKPIIGLSPMDGVTDAAMRYITKKYGNPAVIMTEFTSAEGVRAGALRLMKDFIYSETERPIVAQIFGSDPNAFYKTAIVCAALGFDGVDINMGCPAKSVEEHGAGASLIRTPKLASQIIKATQKGLLDWAEGISLESLDLHPKILSYISEFNPSQTRRLIPVSVKTRIGYDEPVTKDWISHLLEHDLANISLHGRTLKQLYMGSADWDQIGIGAGLVRQTKTSFLGNGDILNLEDANAKIKAYDLSGVLIGRAAQGNPWFFKESMPQTEERFTVAIEHAKYFEKVFPGEHFLPMRKHLAWYIKGFADASDLRQKLVLSNSALEVEEVLKNWSVSTNS